MASSYSILLGSPVWLSTRSHLNFLRYEENVLFLSVCYLPGSLCGIRSGEEDLLPSACWKLAEPRGCRWPDEAVGWRLVLDEAGLSCCSSLGRRCGSRLRRRRRLASVQRTPSMRRAERRPPAPAPVRTSQGSRWWGWSPRCSSTSWISGRWRVSTNSSRASLRPYKKAVSLVERLTAPTNRNKEEAFSLVERLSTPTNSNKEEAFSWVERLYLRRPIATDVWLCRGEKKTMTLQ